MNNLSMTNLTRATMAGPLRDGAERGGGSVAHLIENPEGRAVHNLGRALCGKAPSITWSRWAPETLKVCPRCAKKAAKLAKKAEKLDNPDIERMIAEREQALHESAIGASEGGFYRQGV